MMTHAVVNVRKGGAYLLLAGVQTGAATVEISVEVPQEARNRSTSWSSYTTPAHTQRTPYSTSETHPCSSLFFSQYPGSGNSLGVPQLINGQWKFFIFPQWNIIHPLRNMEFADK